MADIAGIKTIVEESGNSFHCKVARYLKEKEWTILVSPYYMDSATDKPREIDIVAQKIRSHDSFSRGGRVEVTINLFVECKYIPQPNVFWFSDKDIIAATEWVTTKTPLRNKDSFYTKRHHYLATNPEVAKLFAASKTKPNTENEPIYKALNQSLNAMVYLRGRELFRCDPDRFVSTTLGTIDLPVILCNSFTEFYRVAMEGPGEPKPITDNFQLEVNYAYLDNQKQHTTEYFLIDVVEFDKMDAFLKVIENDVNAVFEKS